MIRLASTSPNYFTFGRRLLQVNRTCVLNRIYQKSVANCCSFRRFQSDGSRRFDESRYQQSSSNRQWRRYQNHSDSDCRRQSRRINGGGLFFLPAFSLWSSFKYNMGWEQPKLDEDEIKNKIKYAVMYCREGKFDDALTILHEALYRSEELKNDNAITYCMDMMANIYYYMGRYDEAERTFSTLIQRIVAAGDSVDGVSPTSSPAIIELSLKLADIYAMKGEDDKAISGFEFCVATQKLNVEREMESQRKKALKVPGSRRHDMREDLESTDPYALYGLVLETYARYLVRKGQVDESQIYINRALEMALEIYGSTHPHTLSVMNNFAILCIAEKRFDVAERYLKDVVKRAPLLQNYASAQLTGYYTNYAEVLWHLGKHEESLEYARRAAELAKDKNVDQESRARTEQYLKSLETDWKKESKKRK